MSETDHLPPPPPGAPAVPPPRPAAVDVAPVALEHRVEGLSCPNCAGALAADPGLRVVRCPYCDTPLLALAEIGIRRFAVLPTVDATRARDLARGWLGHGINKDPHLAREAEIGEAFLSFLPFYRVEADCVGIALGTERRTRWTGSGKRRRAETYEVDVERRVERHFDRTYPALNVAELGIRRVDLSGDELVPFDSERLERRGMVFPPTGSASEVRAAALARFAAEADPSRGLARRRFRFLETLRERLSVIYYPLWIVRYRYRGRAYQALVDGEDGGLAYGKAPGNDLYRALALVGTEAVVMFLLTTVLQFGASGPLLALAGGLGLAMFLWGWKRFRHGGVVIEGSGVVEDAAPGVADLQRAMRHPERILTDLAMGRLPEIDL